MKIETNIQRDEEKQSQLREMGWKVIVIWECQLHSEFRTRTLTELEHMLRK